MAGIAVSTFGGAVIGAIVGNDGNAIGRGAVAGAALGVGRCAILLELAAAEDKQKLQQAQLAALEVDRTTTQTIQTKSGRVAKVTTKVTPAPPPKAKSQPKPKKAAAAAKPATEPKKEIEIADAQVPNTGTSPRVDERPVIVNGEPQTSETKPPETEKIEQASVSENAFFDQQPSTVECKFTELLINMDGGSTETGKQKWCRTNGGAWEPSVG